MTQYAGYSIWTAADNSSESLMSFEEFEQSLVLNVLFQEGLVLHDTSMFSSSYLAAHVRNAEGASLFETAAKSGLVVPAFRQAGTASMRAAREAIEKDLGTKVGRFDFSADVLPRMMAAVDLGIQTAGILPKYWPSPTAYSLGEHYEKMLGNLLQRESPPCIAGPGSDKFETLQIAWRATERWRAEFLPEAARLTKLGGGLGLQRQKLYDLLTRQLGISADKATTVGLIHAAKSESPEKGLAMQQFLTWLSEAHFLNQATALELAANFPFYDSKESFILDSIVPGVRAEPLERIGCEVQLPPIRMLATKQASEIVAMRKDLGYGYFASLAHWIEKPSERSKGETMAALADYCRSISRRFDRGAADTYSVQTTRSETRAGAIVEAAPDLLGLGLAKPFVLVAKNIVTRFVRVIGRSKRDQVFSRRARIELTLGRELTAANDPGKAA